jgi:hypothetical protein
LFLEQLQEVFNAGQLHFFNTLEAQLSLGGCPRIRLSSEQFPLEFGEI